MIFLCAGNKKVLACFFESGFSYIFFDGIIFQNVDYNTVITIQNVDRPTFIVSKMLIYNLLI